MTLRLLLKSQFQSPFVLHLILQMSPHLPTTQHRCWLSLFLLGPWHSHLPCNDLKSHSLLWLSSQLPFLPRHFRKWHLFLLWLSLYLPFQEFQEAACISTPLSPVGPYLKTNPCPFLLLLFPVLSKTQSLLQILLFPVLPSQHTVPALKPPKHLTPFSYSSPRVICSHVAAREPASVLPF